MFVRDDSAARVKTVAGVYQGQPAAIPIGNEKYSNAHTELGFFLDEQNLVINAYFDPLGSAKWNDLDLSRVGYILVGNLAINGIVVPSSIFDNTPNRSQLGFKYNEHQPNLAFVDTFATPPRSLSEPYPYPFSPFYVNWNYAQNSRYRASQLENYPQEKGSMISYNRHSAQPVLRNGKFRKVFFSKAITMDPVGLQGGSLDLNIFLRSIEFGDYNLQYGLTSVVKGAREIMNQIISDLTRLRILPDIGSFIHFGNLKQFQDSNGEVGFYINVELPIRSSRADTVQKTVFVVWDADTGEYGCAILPLEDVKEEYEDLAQKEKNPNAGYFLAYLERFGYRKALFTPTNLEFRYSYIAVPCRIFVNRQIERGNLRVKCLEGFEFQVSRTWKQLTGWENTRVDNVLEFDATSQNSSAANFQRLVAEQLFASYDPTKELDIRFL